MSNDIEGLEGIEVTLADIADELLTSDAETLILCHARPDGDCLGSAAALTRTLRRLGRAAYAVNADTDKIQNRLRFLSDGIVISADDLPAGFVPGLVIAVDTAETELLGDYDGRWNIDIKIDHHVSRSLYGKRNFIDAGAAACGQIICELIYMMAERDCRALPCSATIEALYASLVTDSGSFRYGGVSGRTHICAARLFDGGLDHVSVHERLSPGRSETDLSALRIALGGMKRFCGGRINALVIDLDTKAEYGVEDENLTELNTFVRDIEGVDVGITLKQQSDDPEMWKLSMRSTPRVDVSVVCAVFSGGGHLRAAGAMLRAESPDEALRLVLSALEESGQLDCSDCENG